jgi:AraC-like DNA-binding protein
MRIDEAKSLMLENRDTSIEEIASQVGFSSLSTFSSTFKKVVGESPVKWKNSQKL